MNDPGAIRVSRRHFLGGSLVLSGALLLPRQSLRAEEAFSVPSKTADAMDRSPLIYLTPIRSDGSESACHAEVWFAADAGELFVVTPKERWRSQSVKKGLDRARIWVGDFGPWKKSHGEFKTAPTFMASAGFVDSEDKETQKRVLAVMGKKYAGPAWDKYAPKFRQGLTDGSRVMLRYKPVAV